MTAPMQQVPSAPPASHSKISPEMPQIPGVNLPQKRPQDQKPLVAIGLIVALCAAAFGLWFWHLKQVTANGKAPAHEDIETTTISPAPAKKAINTDPDAIATLDELTKPWAAKKFTFVDPNTHQSVPAMVIHLPGTGVESFWAFSMNTPFSQCELQYVTDLATLSQRYAYAATHPMIISQCDGTVYDPLKMATLPDGSWVRGDIVRGGGIRPPIAIEVHVRGHLLIADRIE
jgi:hypothetical protein